MKERRKTLKNQKGATMYEYEMDLAEMTADMEWEMDDEMLEDMAAWYAAQSDRDDGGWEYGITDQG